MLLTMLKAATAAARRWLSTLLSVARAHCYCCCCCRRCRRSSAAAVWGRDGEGALIDVGGQGECHVQRRRRLLLLGAFSQWPHPQDPSQWLHPQDASEQRRRALAWRRELPLLLLLCWERRAQRKTKEEKSSRGRENGTLHLPLATPLQTG